MIEFMGIDWVNARGATLAEMHARKPLWVVEKLPPPGEWRGEIWEAAASPGDTLYRLIWKWADGHVLDLPRPSERRDRVFLEHLHQRLPVALVVHDAGQLRGRVLENVRLLAGSGALVVLVGDVCRIANSTRGFPGFFQRAAYCVPVMDVFGGAS